MKTLTFGRTAGVLVLVHTKAPPDQAEWEAYLAEVVAVRQASKATTLLVVTDGGAPDASQRAQLAQAYGDDPTVTAVCNASPVVQRVITAVGWITRARLRGFAYDDVAGALAYLGVPPSALGAITALVVKLQRQINARVVKT